MRKINVEGLALIKQWEGLRLAAYKDAAGKPYVQAGLKITEAQAEEILARDLGQYERAVAGSVKVPLNDN